MTESKLIFGAGGGSRKRSRNRGGNYTPPAPSPAPAPAPAPVYNPTYTADDPGLRSTSFAQLQFLVCEGEIYGPDRADPTGPCTREDLERATYFDDTPLRTSTGINPQPEDLVLSFGKPEDEQTGVPDYNRVSSTVDVSQQVNKGTPVTQAVTPPASPGEDGDYLGRVLLRFQGLVQQTNRGDVLATTVNYEIKYTDNDGTEREIFSGDLTGKFSGQFQKEYEFEFQGPGPWIITVTRNTDDDDTRNSSSNQYQSTFSFATVVISLNQRLKYPYSSILTTAIRADQYSQLPAVSIDLKGLLIEVPKNYDPDTRTYATTGDGTTNGLWDGTFKVAYSDNPAWILRDLILNDRYGLGEYVSEAQVDPWNLYSIAQYCDQEVKANNDGTEMEPRFTCNLVLQTSEEAWNVLQQLSSIFRGMLYYAGGKIVAVQDRAKTPVFTFNESNTLENVSTDGRVSEGNFTYSGAAKRARHTVCLVSWDDPEDNYQPRVQYVADEAGINRFGYKAMDLRLLGVTSRTQALRAARWALLAESEISDTVTFQTNEIGKAIRPGDLIDINDPNKGAGAARYGGRIMAATATEVTLDAELTEPPEGWSSSTFSFMVAVLNGDEANNPNRKQQPALEQRDIVSASVVDGRTVLTLAAGTNTPVVGFPYLVESASRQAQTFRCLTVEQQEGGVYAVNALRYQPGIYDSVDNDTPLNDDEDYLYKPVTPGAPTWQRAQVIWDNNQAKMDLAWIPAATNAVLNGFDLTTRQYRIQWQAGTYDKDTDTTTWDEVWRDAIDENADNREQLPINEFVASDRFKARVAAVDRYGVQSAWSEVRELDEITTWRPMPDLDGDNGEDPPVKNATLSHFNQSSGSQLFSWAFNVDIPPYVNGIRLQCKPNRALTPTEEKGINPPDADGWYTIANAPLDDYYAVAFHALTTWEARFNLTTAIPGLTGETYATDTVDIAELYPPIPDLFEVVTLPRKPSTPQMRRFSWGFTSAPPFADKWPLGEVTDIAYYDIRFKAGSNVDWDRGYPLFADGVPGDQQYFETELFDSGTWTVMLRPKDQTGWLSEETQFVIVGLADAVPTNVVQRIDLKDICFPGEYNNSQVITRTSGLMYPDPQTELFYQDPQDDEFYEGAAGCNLQQIDVSTEGQYLFPFAVQDNGVGLLVLTQSTSTYQWFLRRVGTSGSNLMYPDPQTDPMYPPPLTDYFYRDVSPGITGEFHPLAPFEKVDSGFYELGVRFQSTDGTALAEIQDVDIILDYPDVMETFNDVAIPAGGGRVNLTSSFRALKSVNITLQQTTTNPQAASVIVGGKSSTGFNVSGFDKDGNPVACLIDANCVGY